MAGMTTPGGPPVDAQGAAARFEVDSVEPNRPGSGVSSANPTGAQLVGTNVPPMWLVRDAYQLQVADCVSANGTDQHRQHDAAMQEQLGLKLDAQRGPVEVLVIDRVEQPTAD